MFRLERTKGKEVEDEVRGLVRGPVTTEDMFRLSEMRSNWRARAEE